MSKIAIIGPHHQDGWDVLKKMNYDAFEIKDFSKTNLIKELKEVEGIALRTTKLDEEILSQCILDNKEKPDFPGLTIDETYGNMKIIDEWLN